MSVSMGNVTSKGGKYFLETNGKTMEISDKTVSDPNALKAMAGKKVEITYSTGPVSFPVSISLPAAKTAASEKVVVVKRVRTSCYLPPPDIRAKIGEINRAQIAEKLQANKLIDKVTFEAIR
jgi:hypothetical protein